jgi:aryl-alcohol dehydrogenase-like predicted oxidoreductase
LQIEYSPLITDIESDKTGILATCRELGISIIAYSPLARGVLTGAHKSHDDLASSDLRKLYPQFAEENWSEVTKVLEVMKKVGSRHKSTVGQITLAWLGAQGEDIIPIPGTSNIKYFEENMGALHVDLSELEVKEIRDAVDAVKLIGSREPEG